MPYAIEICIICKKTKKQNKVGLFTTHGRKQKITARIISGQEISRVRRKSYSKANGTIKQSYIISLPVTQNKSVVPLEKRPRSRLNLTGR